MPLLWGEDFVGWVTVTGSARLDVKVGFIRKRPRDKDFGRELDAEVARLGDFVKRSG
jgi:hypothetical protein